jgi:hypothetical protein
MLQILIGGQQRIEVSGCQLQHLSVSLAGPTHRGHSADVMVGQQLGERPRQRFIEQDAHGQSEDLWRVQAQRLPAHALLWGNHRETGQAEPRRPGSPGDSLPAPVFRERPECRQEPQGRPVRRYPPLPWSPSYTGSPRRRGCGGAARKCLASGSTRRLGGLGAQGFRLIFGAGPRVSPGVAGYLRPKTSFRSSVVRAAGLARIWASCSPTTWKRPSSDLLTT